MEDISTSLIEQLPFQGRFALSGISSVTDQALEQLTNEEKQELETFNNIRRQEEYVTSRLTLKKAASQLGVSQGKLVILKDNLGQPYGVANAQNYYVSIAHTTDQVFCGITTDAPIGIDLEPISRSVPQTLHRRILHPDEASDFNEMETVRLWTIKEAFIKLRGQGLRLNMNQVRLREDGGEFWVEINNDKRAKICSFQSKNNWLAIAYYQ